jgi:hypothetical protein
MGTPYNLIMRDLPVPARAEPSIKLRLPGNHKFLVSPPAALIAEPQPAVRRKLGVPGAMSMGFGPLGPSMSES